MTPIIRFERLTPTAKIPTRATPGSAGLDLYADGSVDLDGDSSAMVSTGIRVCLPAGFEAQIRPRSSLANAWSVTVLNAPGTIDSDYRGEVKVLLINHSSDHDDNKLRIRHGDRIAQLVIQRVEPVIVEEGPINDITERSEGGFGSTGR